MNLKNALILEAMKVKGKMKVKIERKCEFCQSKFEQTTFYKQENGRIKIDNYNDRCPFCKRFVRKPTTEEIRSVLIGK